MLMIIGASGRKLAMFQLGKSFTWEVTKPEKLFQGGIYSYVQHPSYSFGMTSFFAAHYLLVRTGGVAACLGSDIGGWIVLFCWAEFVIFLLAVPSRILEEEKMLYKTFGQEWEDWHRKTARFIPGVF